MECGFIKTEVKDTGIGISDEKKKSLFKLFSLISKNDNGILRSEGIGLGLSICKQLIEFVGGEIQLHSQENEGTRVSFTFPFKCMKCSQNMNPS